MSNRRAFLGVSAAAAAALTGLEALWRGVRQAFVLDPGLVNLNHGYSPSPESVLNALEGTVRRINSAPLQFGHWPEEGPESAREAVRRRSAALLGCDPEELALTRSATEALQIVQLGLTLRAGDEVLSTDEGYWAMWNTWQQRVQRDGITHTVVPLGAPHPAPGEVVERFARAITPRTRVIMISHITWPTGHLLPVAEICRAARDKGVLTIVDGAHGPGQVPVDVRSLGCDFYGASGHKWLMGPLGTGFLYARRELVRDVWPLTPAWGSREDVRKFEWVGGQSTAPLGGPAGCAPASALIDGPRRPARGRAWSLRCPWDRAGGSHTISTRASSCFRAAVRGG